jgi:hypothetical protein
MNNEAIKIYVKDVYHKYVIYKKRKEYLIDYYFKDQYLSTYDIYSLDINSKTEDIHEFIKELIKKNN